MSNPADNITDAMVDAAYNVFAGKMLMREEDRDLIRRMLSAAISVQPVKTDAYRAALMRVNDWDTATMGDFIPPALSKQVRDALASEGPKS